jgi:hypothetical protein
LQARPVWQSAQLPPQSTSASAPFFTPSVQLAAEHVPFAPHTPLWQSVRALHAVPSGQPEQVPPPQSVSISAPLRSSSMQVATAQRPLAGEHSRPL